MDSNLPSPSVPGRPVRVTAPTALLLLQTKPRTGVLNEYVDANPNVFKDKSDKPSANLPEKHDNVINEHRESTQPPELPPRRPPPRQPPPRQPKPTSHRQEPDVRLTNARDRLQPTQTIVPPIRHHTRPPQHTTPNNNRDTKVIILSKPNNARLVIQVSPSTVLQPISSQPTRGQITTSMTSRGPLSNSILCPECGRCRCTACSGHRKLPEHWLCQGTCRCSAETVINTLSCMFCASYCFRKCFHHDESKEGLPKPEDYCSCNGTPCNVLKCCLVTAGLSLVMPCICCYWPMRGGAMAAEACYNSRCVRPNGCQCEKPS